MSLTDKVHPHIRNEEDSPLGLSDFLGLSLIERVDGTAHFHFTIEQEHANLMGNMNGGVVYAASDMVAYNALLSILPHDKAAVTSDLQVSMLRGGRIGDKVDVRAEVVKLGRTLAFIEVRSFVDGKLIATAKLTKAVLDI